MKRQLPPRANLEHLRHQAKELLKAYKAGEAGAVARVRESHPRRSGATDATGARLSDAQLVVAREYGFASWPALKKHVESRAREAADPIKLVKQAFSADDAAGVRALLGRYPELRRMVNEPVGPFDSPAVVNVCSRAMLDVLLEAGADINARSRWWAGGFGLLDSAEPELAAYAIGRGAVVDAHAAARLGIMERLKELVARDPRVVHARGGDGQTPLHFANTVEVAAFLLAHGAEIDAEDVDHESTPAQWMVKDRQDVARYLVGRGCRTDLLMAAALGDLGLARRHLDAEPGCVGMRVDERWFPKRDPRGGGTIYQWTLGFHVSAHDVARRLGHAEVLALLVERSPGDVRLIEACWSAEEEVVRGLVESNPGLTAGLSEEDRRQVAHAARNNNTAAVRLMLRAGWPVDARGQHGATPLHWGAWHGNVEMVREVLRYGPPLEDAGNEFGGTPMRWAVHGSENGWHCRTGDYGGVVEALLEAGARRPEKVEGSEAVRRALSALP